MLWTPSPIGLLADGKRGGTHFVGRAHVNPVHFSMRRDRREVHDAGHEHDWQPRVRKRPEERPEPFDATRFTRSAKISETETGLAEISGSGERHAVTGWPDHKIERRDTVFALERAHDYRWICERVGSRQRSIQENEASVDSAQIDAEGTGVDPDHARHGGTLLVLG